MWKLEQLLLLGSSALTSIFLPPTFITFIELPSGQSHAKIDQMQIDNTMVLTGSTDRPAPPKKSIGRLHEAPVATKYTVHCYTFVRFSITFTHVNHDYNRL